MCIIEKLKNLSKKNKIKNAGDLESEQEKINEEFNRDGLTDSVLDKQVELNKLRNEMNIPDKNSLNEDGWSQ